MWPEGRCIFGVIAASPVVQVVQVLARSGRDFILIDSEHGPIGPAEAHSISAATAGTPLVPLTRAVSTTAWHAKVPLDLGAMGLLPAGFDTHRHRRRRCVE
jgi:4-hydroxy-2-oxoheptanedioate aldolase